MIKLFTKKRNKKGFTLIELVVVVAILGILAAIAIPRLNGSKTAAEKSACQGTQRTISSAASIYEAQNGSQPAAGNIGALVTAGLLAETPKCPTTGTLTLDADGTVKCSITDHN